MKDSKALNVLPHRDKNKAFKAEGFVFIILAGLSFIPFMAGILEFNLHKAIYIELSLPAVPDILGTGLSFSNPRNVMNAPALFFR